VAALTGRLVKNTVNIPSISPQALAVVKPYLGLAEKLGRFMAHVVAGRVSKVEVIYSGDMAGQEVAPITTAVVKGLLDPILQETVNFVNAPLLARGRGIQVQQSVDGQEEGYSSLITVKVGTDREERTISGTLFGAHDPRIVMIDGYRVDAYPAGYMFYVQHVDKPRVAGSVATLIGDHGINIATMQVGRREIGGRAIMVITVDGEIPGAIAGEIMKVPGVAGVKVISL
jgi:D-3-phosphoglycerate dehydrogenase